MPERSVWPSSCPWTQQPLKPQQPPENGHWQAPTGTGRPASPCGQVGAFVPQPPPAAAARFPIGAGDTWAQGRMEEEEGPVCYSLSVRYTPATGGGLTQI